MSTEQRPPQPVAKSTKSEQVIHLLGDEDFHGVRSLLTRVQADRVILDVPRQHPAFRNEVRLKVLARQAYENGFELAIATRDPDIRDRAKAIHLAVFRSVEAAQKAHRWSRPTFETPANGHETPLSTEWLTGHRALEARREQIGAPANWADRFVLIGLVLGLLIVLAAGALLLVPSAQITLVPEQSLLTIPFEATADTDAEGPVRSQMVVPAERFSIIVEGTGQMATTGRRDVPDAKARGEVTLVNLLPQDVTVPRGTIVRTSAAVPVRFQTLEDVVVPANGQITVPIEALNPGLTGNVGALLINQVEGPLASALRVFNTNPTSGGTVKQVATVTVADKDQLREQVVQRLTQEGTAEIAKQVPEGYLLIPNTLTFDAVTESFDHLVDEQADTLTLLYRLRVEGLIVRQEDVEFLARPVLRENVPADRELLAEGFAVRIVDGERLSSDQARFTAEVEGFTAARIDGNMVRDLVRGLPVEEAEVVLKNRLPLAADPGIEISPAGWGRMPYLPLRIYVRVAALPPQQQGASQ